MRRRLLFAAAAGAALLALLPLRLALDASGISAVRVGGTVWRGELVGAAWRGLVLGDVTVRLRPGLLAGGRVAHRLDGGGWTGTVWRRPGGGFGVDGVDGRLPLSGLLPLPVAAVDAAGLSLSFNDGRCVAAAGRLHLALPDLPGAGRLEAAPRCDGDQLLLPFAAADGRTRLDVRLSPARWTARLAVSAPDAAQRPGLAAAGFRPAPGSMVLTREGRFR